MKCKLEDKRYDLKVGSILIEVNPTYTHNATEGFVGQEPYATKYYHRDKTFLANSHGYRVIHVFEKDFDQLEKVLQPLLPKRKVYARNTVVKSGKFRDFMNEHHRQGASNSSNGYGLFDKKTGELYACITFSTSRNKSAFKWELKRLCFKTGVMVVGGSEKLFKHWLKNDWDGESVGSYCDLTYNTGGVYERLGFELSHISDPNYKWVDQTSNTWLAREQCQRHKLAKRFNNPDYKNKEWTEKSIMEKEGYVKVYDVGNAIYIFSKKNRT